MIKRNSKCFKNLHRVQYVPRKDQRGKPCSKGIKRYGFSLPSKTEEKSGRQFGRRRKRTGRGKSNQGGKKREGSQFVTFLLFGLLWRVTKWRNWRTRKVCPFTLFAGRLHSVPPSRVKSRIIHFQSQENVFSIFIRP